MSRLATLIAASTLAAALTLPALAGDAASLTGSGTFTGKSNHITTGGVSVVQTTAGAMVVLAPDFSLDGAPDPRVGLGKAGTYDEATDAGALATNTGAQVYSLPAGVDPAAYDEVYIWCRKFSVPLGVASLQ